MANAHVLPNERAERLEAATSTTAPISSGAISIRRFASLLAKWFKSLRIQVPEGYEDESGFHVGVEPRRGLDD
jgi:hypothetical protein